MSWRCDLGFKTQTHSIKDVNKYNKIKMKTLKQHETKKNTYENQPKF